MNGVKHPRRQCSSNFNSVPLWRGSVNSVSMVIQLWKPIKLRTPENGDSTFSKTSGRNSAHSIKPQKTSVIDTAVKASQKTVFFELQQNLFMFHTSSTGLSQEWGTHYNKYNTCFQFKYKYKVATILHIFMTSLITQNYIRIII
jgi:hypothetical protein